MGLSRRRLLDFAFEVLIGIGLVAAVILYATFGPFSWMPSAPWWGLAGETALLAWMTIKYHRNAWRRRGFWLALIGLLGLHWAAWTVLLLRTTVRGLFWFAPATVIEGLILTLVLAWLGYDPLKPRGRAA